MSGMHEHERVAQPSATLAVEPRKRIQVVALVLRLLDVLRLEQEDDLRPPVRDAVVRSLDQPRVGQPDRWVAPADPRVAVGGLAEDVEAPDARRGFPHPGLMRVCQPIARVCQRRRLPLARDDQDLETGERFRDLVEAGVRHRDLEVFVLAPPPAEEEIDRPAGCDIPRNANVLEQTRDLLRAPRVPLRNVRVDRAHGRNCGSTFFAKSRIWSCRFAPHSSSMTCVQPAARYSSIAAMQSAGVPAIGLHLSRIASVTCSFAARRPPRSIASATGRISSTSIPARSSSVSAAPLMFCTLFARYMPAISRAPSRPWSRSSAIEATIVQPMSMSACTF